MIHELDEASIRSAVAWLGVTEFEVLRDPDVFGFRSPFGTSIMVELAGDAAPFTECRAFAAWAAAIPEDHRGEAHDILNTWNSRKRFGTAYFDGDGDPCIDFNFDVMSGVAEENLRVFFRRVLRVTGRFDFAVVARLRSLGKPFN